MSAIAKFAPKAKSAVRGVLMAITTRSLSLSIPHGMETRLELLPKGGPAGDRLESLRKCIFCSDGKSSTTQGRRT